MQKITILPFDIAPEDSIVTLVEDGYMNLSGYVFSTFQALLENENPKCKIETFQSITGDWYFWIYKKIVVLDHGMWKIGGNTIGVLSNGKYVIYRNDSIKGPFNSFRDVALELGHYDFVTIDNELYYEIN